MSTGCSSEEKWKDENDVQLTRHDGLQKLKTLVKLFWDSTTSCSWLSCMAKIELSIKFLQNLLKDHLKYSQSMQQYSIIAGDILVWDFLAPCLLFKTPRTPWFDNDLIARYFQFEYSKGSLKD